MNQPLDRDTAATFAPAEIPLIENIVRLDRADLSQIAAADLTGCSTVSQIAEREGWQDANGWALRLSTHITNSDIPLDTQRERLAALCAVGALADQATAEALTQHAIVLESLFYHMARTAHNLSVNDQAVRYSVHAERFLNASLKAQRAALACMSAVKVPVKCRGLNGRLRQTAPAPNPPAPIPDSPAPLAKSTCPG